MPIPADHAKNLATALARGRAGEEQVAREVLDALRQEQSVVPGAINEPIQDLIEQLRQEEPDDRQQ